MGIESYSTTPASNNASPPNGWPESMAPSSVNDCARQLMADIRTLAEDAQWFNYGNTPTRVDDNTFTVATDLTARYHVGRRLKLTGSATGYCTISATSYSAPNTTVDVTMDSGNIPGTLSAVYVAILTATNGSLPSPLPAVSGANLTALNATNLASGTVADARLSSNVPLKNAANTFTESQTISKVGAGALSVTNSSASITSYFGSDGSAGYSGTETNHPFRFYSNNTLRGEVAAAGNWTVNAPDSGVPLTSNISGSGTAFRATDGTIQADIQVGSSTAYFGAQSNHAVGILTNGSTKVTIGTSGGVQFGSPTGGDKGAGTLNAAGSVYVNGVELGFREVPQNAQTGNYTCVLADSGKHIYHASGAGSGDTYTIPANASVAYPVGTVLTFVNDSTDSVDIAITSDTMRMAGTGDTGTRTLAQDGIATAIKVTSTSWKISGTGLT